MSAHGVSNRAAGGGPSLKIPMEACFIGEREIPIRAVHTRSERLKDLVSQAYREKYNTPGSIQFVKGYVAEEVTRHNDGVGSNLSVSGGFSNASPCNENMTKGV